MITKIGLGFNNYYSNRLKEREFRPNFKNEVSKDTFVSFTGADSQKAKIENIMLYADFSTKNLFKELWSDAKKEKYNTITPLIVIRKSLKDTSDYIEALDNGKIEFDAEEMPDMAYVLAGNINNTIFSNADIRKKIKPIIKKYVDIFDKQVKENKPKKYDENKNLALSSELIDYIWSYRAKKNDTITPDVILGATLNDNANQDVIDNIDEMLHELNNKTMIDDTPLKLRKPFSGYEERARNVIKNLSLGTDMFITYDANKDDPKSFIDTIHKIAEKESAGKIKVVELNELATESFFADQINKINKDKNQDYLLIVNPMSIIVNFTPVETISENKFAVPPIVRQNNKTLPQNLKVLFYDSKNNYYTFSDVGNYSRFQEITIPTLNSDQMIKYFRENPKLTKELKVPFTRSASEKVIAAAAQLDGAFPEKTLNLMKKIISYNINKKEITDKDVNSYLKEATDLLKKSNDNSSIEVVFDTGKHLKQMTGKSSTRKEAEQIVKQIKSKKMGTKGIIIYSQDGSPGSGRKFTAQAIAGDAKVPYIEINTVDFGTKDVEIFGDMLSPEASMKKLFSIVRTQAESNPNKSAVLFIENFEYFSIGELVSHYHQKAMAQLLREMEKAEASGLNILVAGSVSNPDLIGEATMKSFKFVDSIEVASPAINKEDREKIIEQSLKDYRLKISEKADRSALISYAADISDGFSSILLKNLIKKCKSVAQERNHKFIDKSDITEAYLQLTTGRPSPSKNYEHDKMITTSHECGHATNLTVMNDIARNYGKAWHIPAKVNFVTLDPRGFYGGAVYDGSDINREMSFETAFADLVCTFGGNSAEKHFYGMDGSWGITSDMDHIRRLSAAMVKKMGFGAQVGKMNIGPYDDLSDKMKQMVEEDQRVIINNAQIASELITYVYEDFNKKFTEKYSPLVGTGDCVIDGDLFRKNLREWKLSQSPEKQKELELCDKTILQIIEATKKGITVKKES